MCATTRRLFACKWSIKRIRSRESGSCIKAPLISTVITVHFLIYMYRYYSYITVNGSFSLKYGPFHLRSNGSTAVMNRNEPHYMFHPNMFHVKQITLNTKFAVSHYVYKHNYILIYGYIYICFVFWSILYVVSGTRCS